jgi:hypothetical protein
VSRNDSEEVVEIGEYAVQVGVEPFVGDPEWGVSEAVESGVLDPVAFHVGDGGVVVAAVELDGEFVFAPEDVDFPVMAADS